MIAAIRSTGSKQLVNVGHDEGGVADRLLNQFYGDAGVAFTTNHTWWRDDALLWDSVVAKRPGLPNLVGETGVQPASRIDTSWRWDEVGALGLYERKLALGLAAANAGSLQWDWAKGDAYGIKRSDGSNKIWQDVLRGMAQFALKAAPHITHARAPEVAIVLPQSLQLSVFNGYALDAQQQCVRALYHYARASAYVVGEYQIQLLGDPRLIILPSPWVLHTAGLGSHPCEGALPVRFSWFRGDSMPTSISTARSGIKNQDWITSRACWRPATTLWNGLPDGPSSAIRETSAHTWNGASCRTAGRLPRRSLARAGSSMSACPSS